MMISQSKEEIHANETGYFCHDVANDSWAGILHEETLSESQINEYVQYENPRLFRRLRGMPFSSTDIPLSYHGFKALKKTDEVQQILEFRSQRQNHHDSRIQSSTCQHPGADELVSPTDSATKPEEVKNDSHISIREQVLKKISCGFVLILYRLRGKDCTLQCASPFCSDKNINAKPGSFYLSLRYSSKQTHTTDFSQSTVFHLQCLEHVFDHDSHDISLYHADCARPLHAEVMSDSLDGVSHDDVLKAATRLQKVRNEILKKRKIAAGGSTSQTVPNTNSAADPSMEKERDTEETLKEVARYEELQHHISSDLSSQGSSSPELLITRPSYMEKPKERYKKQGLTAYCLNAANKEQAIIRKKSFQELRKEQERALAAAATERHCYCREPDDGEHEMIRCSSEWCTIGWFHLSCTDLKCLPVIGEEFYCDYCRDDFGPFIPHNQTQMESRVPNVNAPPSVDTSGQNESENDDAGYSSDVDEGADYEEDSDVEETSSDMTSSCQLGGAQTESKMVEVETAPPPPTSSGTWGTPINSPAGRRYLEQYEKRKQPSSPTPLPKRHRTIPPSGQLDGIEHPNGLRTLLNTPTQLSHDISLPPLLSPERNLNASSAEDKITISDVAILLHNVTTVRFRDLAPFIVADDLTTEEAAIFKRWKTESNRLSIFANTPKPEYETRNEALRDTGGVSLNTNLTDLPEDKEDRAKAIKIESEEDLTYQSLSELLEQVCMEALSMKGVVG